MEHIVRIGLSRRSEGLTRAAAQAYWRTVHADVFRKLPKLVSYVQNHAVLVDEDHALLDDCPFDIFAEVTFATGQDLTEASSSEYYRSAILPDEANLLVPEGRSFLLLHRDALRPPAPAQVTLAAFLSEEWNPAAGGQAPAMIERIEEGSGPIGSRTRFYAQWRCDTAAGALSLYQTLLGERCFAGSLVAATVVRPNVVVGSAAGGRCGAAQD